MILEFLVIFLAVVLLSFSTYALKTLFAYISELKQTVKKDEHCLQIHKSSETVREWTKNYEQLETLFSKKVLKDQIYNSYLEMHPISTDSNLTKIQDEDFKISPEVKVEIPRAKFQQKPDSQAYHAVFNRVSSEIQKVNQASSSSTYC